MIKIQEHLNRVDADAFLDSLADELWTELNQKYKTKSGFKSTSLIEKCKKFKSQTSTKEYQKIYANGDVSTAKRHKAFFDFLLKDRYKELKRIITSRPTQFASIIADILEVINLSDFVSGAPEHYAQTKFGVLISEVIFDYGKFRESKFCKELFTKIGFDSATCPYCNNRKLDIVQIRSNSTKETKKRAYYDIDHFYPKSINPFFAVSFYNLIPSCHDCNSSEKRSLPFSIETHLHPYYEAFDDFYSFEISDLCLFVAPIDKILITPKGRKPLDKTIFDLKLDDRYQANLSEIDSLLKFYRNYQHLMGTSDEQFFIDSLFELKGVPKKRVSILKKLQGKMNRDILKLVDEANGNLLATHW